MDKSAGKMTVDTFSSIQTIKYFLASQDDKSNSAIKYFLQKDRNDKKAANKTLLSYFKVA